MQEERVDGCSTADVQVEIYTAIVVKDKVADHVCTLDVVRVAIECW